MAASRRRAARSAPSSQPANSTSQPIRVAKPTGAACRGLRCAAGNRHSKASYPPGLTHIHATRRTLTLQYNIGKCRSGASACNDCSHFGRLQYRLNAPPSISPNSPPAPPRRVCSLHLFERVRRQPRIAQRGTESEPRLRRVHRRDRRHTTARALRKTGIDARRQHQRQPEPAVERPENCPEARRRHLKPCG